MTACTAAAADRADGSEAAAGGDSGACRRTTAVLGALPEGGGDVPGAPQPAMPASAAATTRVPVSFIRALSYSSRPARKCLAAGAATRRNVRLPRPDPADRAVLVVDDAS